MGYKLHLIINRKEEITAIKITKANKSDLACAAGLAKGLKGKVCGDKAYISKDLFNRLYNCGLRMLTNITRIMAKR